MSIRRAGTFTQPRKDGGVVTGDVVGNPVLEEEGAAGAQMFKTPGGSRKGTTMGGDDWCGGEGGPASDNDHWRTRWKAGIRAIGPLVVGFVATVV